MPERVKQLEQAITEAVKLFRPGYIAIEAAWSYRLRPGIGPALRKPQESVAEEIKEIAWKAQHRLHKRYYRLATAGKDQRKIITAVGRDGLSRTRNFSQRQVPTDHDYAVSTREYQTDQSQLKPAPATAGPVLEKFKFNNKNNPTHARELTGSCHIRAFSIYMLPF